MTGTPVEVAKSAHDIIEAASQSTLGIFALIILIVGVLAYAFFRKSPIKVRVGIFVAIFLGAVLYGFAITAATRKASADKLPNQAAQVTPPAGPTLTDEEEIRSLISREAELSMRTNRESVADEYKGLFAEDAHIEDAQNASDHADGIDEIRRRFVTLPGFVDLVHRVTGAVRVHNVNASASAITTGKMRLASGRWRDLSGGESWEFRKENSKWKIALFKYNIR